MSPPTKQKDKYYIAIGHQNGTNNHSSVSICFQNLPTNDQRLSADFTNFHRPMEPALNSHLAHHTPVAVCRPLQAPSIDQLRDQESGQGDSGWCMECGPVVSLHPSVHPPG